MFFNFFILLILKVIAKVLQRTISMRRLFHVSTMYLLNTLVYFHKMLLGVTVTVIDLSESRVIT